MSSKPIVSDTVPDDLASAEAEHFLYNETQFHLGAMLTEQSHPKTRGLSEQIASNTVTGLNMLLSVDDDIAPVANNVIRSEAYEHLRADLLDTLKKGGRIFFTGCGATGRLAILLDAACRHFCHRMQSAHPAHSDFFAALSDRTLAIMTGGDFALIRSVESFEDYIAFGYRQMTDAGLKKGDCLVAISEGGETSSVIGTIHAALDTGAATHFAFNNPNEVLVSRVERSRNVIENPAVNVINLATGPMAVAGSTRMQATTIEMLIVGTAMESALYEYLTATFGIEIVRNFGLEPTDPQGTLDRFQKMLQQIRSNENLAVMAELVDFEHSLYADQGLVTYFPSGFSLDIFTDTTERSPTFKIPPFRSTNETGFPVPWAFVKDPLLSTAEAWKQLLGRDPLCITWKPDDYRKMGAKDSIVNQPPQIGPEVLNTFLIGNEPDDSRTETKPNAAIAFLVGEEALHWTDPSDWNRAFQSMTDKFQFRKAVIVTTEEIAAKTDLSDENVFLIKVDLPQTPLKLFAHLATKIVLNNVSTGTMAKLGRLTGNWMAHVDTTNKKLIDRGIRLISELAGLEYKEACYLLFHSIHEMSSWPESRRKVISPVAYTIDQIKAGNNGTK